MWHEDGWNKALVNHSDPHTGVEKYRQMIAEWYRRGHAKNSNSVVLDPFEKLGISSPRTELLPKRIYRYLGQICWAHGLGFDDYVIKTLPFRQTGLGTENCHPRFVACLLRLGDLFDIDDNRFCPVMARQVGNMPSFSETHKHKHQAIREFQLDNETVSITAICSTEMAYIECRNWFDWIKEEIQNQMSQWKNIVPSREFGLLPTINKLDVEMDDSKILLNDKPMKFSLDERSAIELLQGNNLYKDDMSIYRELIQNAIDATMIRVWLEHGQEHSTKKLPENANPYDAETRELFADYPVILDCKKIADNEDSTLWEFSIEDNGVGISRTDLEYMQKIAGSKNNKEKQKIIRQMPEWMQPSGEFGIGLHSAFLLMKDLPVEQQKITIFTKSRLTHESLKIELNSPLSGKAGYCFIEEIEDKGSYGTKLLVNKLLENIESQSKEALLGNPSELFLYEEYTPIYKILDEIYEKITSKTVVIKYLKSFEDIQTKIKEKFENPQVKRYDNCYWCKSTQSVLTVTLDDFNDIETFEIYNPTYPKNRDIRVSFRGQFISYFRGTRNISNMHNILNIPCFSFSIDIYNEHSSSILDLSKDSIKHNNKINEIFEKTFQNLLNDIKNESFDALEMLDNKKEKYSLFLKFFDIPNINYTDLWKKFIIGNDIKLEDILALENFTTYSGFKRNLENSGSSFRLDNEEVINSSALSKLVKSYRFRSILSEYGFKTYTFDNNSKKNSHHNQYLFSKNLIDNDNYIETQDRKFKQLLNLKNSYSFFDKQLNPILNIDNIDNSFFPSNNLNNYKDIFIQINNEKYFIFPFIHFKNLIVEINAEEIYKLYGQYINVDFSRFDSLYSEIKNHIVKRAQDADKFWWHAYERGRGFKTINLEKLNDSLNNI